MPHRTSHRDGNIVGRDAPELCLKCQPRENNNKLTYAELLTTHSTRKAKGYVVPVGMRTGQATSKRTRKRRQC